METMKLIGCRPFLILFFLLTTLVIYCQNSILGHMNKITGESTLSGYVGWMNVLHVAGNGGWGWNPSSPDLPDTNHYNNITIYRLIDSASPLIREAAAGADTIATMQFDMFGSFPPDKPFYIITMEGCEVLSYYESSQMQGCDGVTPGEPAEKFEIRPARISYTWKTYDSNGMETGSYSFGWDFILKQYWTPLN